MQDSRIHSRSVPDGILDANPSMLANATEAPFRVLVRNSGPSTIFIGFAAADVSMGAGGATTSSAYRLLPGEADVFVLAPKQTLYAAAAGPAGRVSVMISEAFPTM